MEMFTYLQKFVDNNDTAAAYILTVICFAMIIDFFSGTLAAKISPDIEFKSKIGIKGILQKIASIALLIFFIPLAPIVPGGAGVGLLYVLYVGYLLMEIKSILENYKKMGNDVTLFFDFLKHIKKDDKEDKE